MTGQLGLKLMRDGLCAGVDEAGRGPLAGPVVAAAVILDPKRRIRGVRDSKQVDPEEREALAVKIRQHALAWSVAWADVEEIDTHNILEATHLAMRRALMGLRIGPAHVQIDGNRCPAFSGLGLDCTFEPIIDGDALRVCIGAASILAKVTRDRMMTQLDQVYPQYGFAVHKGYGTPAHYDVLDAIGPSPIHRRSFEPVRLAEEAHLKRQMRKRRRSPSLALPRGAGEGAAPAHPCAPLHSDSRPAESVEAAVMTALADAR